ncbi:hypothetical protein ABPG72_005219 [Tetrahymena utriculariae]
MKNQLIKRNQKIISQNVVLTLQQLIQKSKLFSINSNKYIQITNSICQLLIQSNLPFNLVENDSFINLMQVIEPRYSYPKRKYFSQNWINYNMNGREKNKRKVY